MNRAVADTATATAVAEQHQERREREEKSEKGFNSCRILVERGREERADAALEDETEKE